MEKRKGIHLIFILHQEIMCVKIAGLRGNFLVKQVSYQVQCKVKVKKLTS